MKKTKKTKISLPKCHSCKTSFETKKDAQYHYCYGCKVHICADCEKNFSLMGPHSPQAHLEDDPYP